MPFSIDNEHPKLKSIPYDFKNFMAKHILKSGDFYKTSQKILQPPFPPTFEF